MKKKLFIAINPPENVKRKLFLLKEKFFDLPVKWTKEENIHITLFFIGSVLEKEEDKFTTILGNISKNSDAFNLTINNISYAPLESKRPRMIWANIQISDSLISLRKKIHKESNEFHPHLTLAKINLWEFNKIDSEEILIIDEEIDIHFKVNSIELMESKIIRGNVEYKILKSFKLKNQL